MFRLQSSLMFGALLALTASAAFAQTYRWTDKDGRVHYTDTPPPRNAASVEKKAVGGGGVVDTRVASYATQQAMKNFPVTLYTASNCAAPCDDGRRLLTKRGVPFREVSVADDASREALKRVSDGDQVPVLVVGKDVRKGFESGMWTSALDAAGYPTSAPPLPAAPAATTAPNADKPVAKPADKPTQAQGPYAPRF